MTITKDGHIVAMHDLLLDDTTNADTVFPADRKNTKLVAGSNDQEDPYRTNVTHTV